MDFGIMKWVQPLQPTNTVEELGLGLTLCKGTDLRRVCAVLGTPPLSWSTGFLVVLHSHRRRVRTSHLFPGDLTNELVRHFLIETSSRGVKLKGCPNEPNFGKCPQHAFCMWGWVWESLAFTMLSKQNCQVSGTTSYCLLSLCN